MKITAAVVSSGFSNVEDNVLFCRPECWRDLSHFIGDCPSEWAHIELPDNVALDGPDYGNPEDFNDEKYPDSRITAWASGKYDPKKDKWVRKIHIVCSCGHKTVWRHTVEY